MRHVVPLLLLASLAACGDADRVHVDPGHFALQRFDCDPSTPLPDCPPFICRVDSAGVVSSCESGCQPGVRQTSFEGPEGFDLCVPARCTVSAPGEAPECTFDRCSPDDVTVYLFEFPCDH